MSAKQELKAQIGLLRVECKTWRNAATELRAALDDASDTIARLNDQLDARDAADPLTTPAPRPFRVGDRVRVAEGATYRTASGLPLTSRAVGLFGSVTRIARDGDLWVHVGSGSGDWASPEFCTLIEPEPEPEGRVYAIRSDTPPGLVVTEDGSLLNWEGVNYVRQPEPDLTPERVTLTLEDGTRITFDAVVTR